MNVTWSMTLIYHEMWNWLEMIFEGFKHIEIANKINPILPVQMADEIVELQQLFSWLTY